MSSVDMPSFEDRGASTGFYSHEGVLFPLVFWVPRGVSIPMGSLLPRGVSISSNVFIPARGVYSHEGLCRYIPFYVVLHCIMCLKLPDRQIFWYVRCTIHIGVWNVLVQNSSHRQSQFGGSRVLHRFPRFVCCSTTGFYSTVK